MKKITFIDTILPDTLVDQSVRENYKEKIQQAEATINSYREAIEKEGLTFDKDLLNTLKQSETAIYDMMDKAYNDYAKTLKFVPKIELDRIKQTYIDIAHALEKINRDINGVLSGYKYDFQVKSGKFSFDGKQVKDHTETLGIREFSELEKEYVKLLNAATKAIVDCANFEIEHNIEVYSLGTAILSPTGKDTFIPLPRGLANDAKTGIVNVERILKGIKGVD